MLRDVIWREKFNEGRTHPPFIPKNALAIRKVLDSDFQIFAVDGSVLTGKSADSGPKKFQGASVDLVWIDEECEGDVFNECYQRTVDCEGKILITLTPLADISSGIREPWVFRLYEDFKRGQADLAFVALSVLDNPHVPQEEKTKLLEKWAGHPEEKARLYGGFFHRSGLVYFMWKPSAHLYEPRALPGNWRTIVTIDGASTGVTAALWCKIDPKGNLWFYREYYERDLIVSDHAKNMIVRSMGEQVDLWLLDPKWGTQKNPETHRTNAQLYRDAGIPVRLAEVNADYGVNESREYLSATVLPNSRHPAAYFGRDLVNFQDEIAHYVWGAFSKGDQKELSKDKPQKGRDHAMNAMQYLCAMRPKGFKDSRFATDEEKRKQANVNSYT